MKYPMKWVFGALFAGGVVSISAASLEGAGRKEFDRQTERLSARLLLTEWAARFAVGSFAAGQARLEREMRAAPDANAAVAAARKHAAVWLDDELRGQYRQAAERLLEPFAETLDPALRERWLRGDDAFFSGRVQQLLPMLFAQVRAKLADEQRRRVFKKIYLAPAEFEQFDDAALQKILTGRFRSGLQEPLWEENAVLLQEQLVAPLIASGRTQQRLQREAVARATVPATVWTEAAAAAEIEKSVIRSMAEKMAESECLELFPQTRAAIRRRAGRLAFERTIAALAERPSAASYRRLLETDNGAHREPEKSFQTVESKICTAMIADAQQRAGVPDAVRPAVAADAEVRRAAKRRFQTAVIPELRRERADFARVQARQYWPELGTSWKPQPLEVEAFAASGAQVIPRLAARPAPRPLLIETEQQMEALLRTQLSAEAVRLENQRAAVVQEYEAVFQAMLDQRRTARASWLRRWFGAGSVSQEEIVACYREHVENNTAPPLFPVVESEIEARSRAILQLLQEQDASALTAPPELPQMVFTVRLSETDGKVAIQLDDWRVRADRIEAAEALIRELRRRMAAVKKPVRFEIRLSVAGQQVYYRTVADLREALRQAVSGVQVLDFPQ